MKTTNGANVVFDALAPFYESHWGPAFLDDATALFQEFLAPRCNPGARILDLCCGAGHFSGWLERHGFAAVGVDASQGMIDFAARKAPRARFYRANMTDFHAVTNCDAAVCFYNSMNQALTPSDLRATIESVHRHLKPGAPFLFDCVVAEGYAQTWRGSEQVTCGERTCNVDYRYQPGDDLAVCDVQIRSLREPDADKLWRFYQRPVDLSSLLEVLAVSGFRLEQVCSSRGQANPPDGRVIVLVSCLQ